MYICRERERERERERGREERERSITCASGAHGFSET